MTKNEVLTTFVIILLLFTAMINWNIYSWLILVAIILTLTVWYSKSESTLKPKPCQEHLENSESCTYYCTTKYCRDGTQ
ncbi:hypothetical protein MUP01_06525 [Candidatus Bathyarchaeota archaeon]|nr:hypothetical protein [Candidatus Bathyarchaeota archaeon]